MAFLRFLLVFLVLAVAVFLSLFVWMLPRRTFFGVARAWHRTLCRAVGVQAHYRSAGGGEADELAPGTLVVSNHVSWLDILVIGGRWSVVFLAMSDVRRWPVIGWLAARTGTLFIERGSGAREAAREIGEALGSDQSVVLFPEARTSDGLGVRRFHGRLFQAALEGDRPIRPLAIRYLDAAGRPDPRPSFAGDVSLLASLWRVLRGGPLRVEATLFEPLPGGLDSRRAAALAEERVRGAVVTPPPRG